MYEDRRLRIVVVGSGYVGTTMAASFADLGHQVTAVDIDEDVVEALHAGDAPIHEPGLADLIERHAGGNLEASTAYDSLAGADLVYLAVQTPTDEAGNIDTTALETAARMSGEAIADQPPAERPVIVIKSTVTPPHVETIRAAAAAGAGDETLEVAMNPEFLREGSAVSDFREPDKLVFGTSSQRGDDMLTAAFEPIIEATNPVVIRTDPDTAAMIKYANNAFLAAKISLINDLGNICKEFGIDAYEVADAIGADDRIGEQFLRSGVGWGGSCFPKDVRAIIQAATAAGYRPAVLEAAVAVNAEQPARMLELLDEHVDVEDQRVAVLGLAFKPGTDDVRNSRAIPLIEGLQERGANVVAYDPVASEEMQARIPEIEYAKSAARALDGAVGALIVTAWDEFETLDDAFDAMDRQLVVDGRRVIEPRPGMTYEGLTW